MGQALHYLHTEKHLMHGDLKSANVLIAGDFQAVFRIRIYLIHMFLGLPDPDPLVRGMDPYPALDPDPSIMPLSSIKIVKKTLISTVLFCDFFWTYYLFKMM
jgi:hypothetical protein